MMRDDPRDEADYLARARRIREDFLAAIDDLSGRLGRLEGRVMGGANRAHETLEQGLSSTRGEISANPLVAVSIAAGLGFLVGMMLIRRR